MSDYRDIEKEAREKGILLDKCGLIDRYYDFGSYQDFCGMTPQEILDNMRKAGQGGGGGGSEKTTVSITATVVSNGTDWVVKAVSNTVLPDQVTITVTADGEPKTMTMSAGSLEETSTWTVDKYATVSAMVTPSTTETANYKVTITNPNGDGMKNISIKTYKDGQETEVETISAKVGSNVEINIDELVDCNFDNWEVNGVTGETKPLEFVMPDVDNLEVNIYYEIKTFTVRFLNWDGSIIETETVKYNTTPSYSGEEPTKPEDEQFTYDFDGWDKPFAPITEDTDYTAVFTETLRTYQIQFLNYDGEVLQSSEITYGTTPVYQGATPTKESDVEYDYTFSGWTPEIVSVSGDATYTAVFSETLRQYTITWIISGESEEETLDYGTMPTHADPESAHTPEYDYTFSGWTPEIVPVEGNATYTAVFNETHNSYPISVTNFDPAIIDVTISGETYVSTDVYPYGAEVVVRAEIKDEYKSQIHFVSFDDVWETTITVGETNVVSVPNVESDEYLVIWDNEGTELYREWLAYGLTPEYSGATPTKETTPQYTYAFSGWTPEIVPVSENATYSAVFSETVREYPISISGLSNDVQVTVNGTPYSAETEYAYGTTVRIEAEVVNKPEYHFVDSGDTWETEITVTDVNVVVLPAIVKDTYSVTWYNDTPYRRYYNWNDTHTYDGTYLTKEDLWYDDGVTARAAGLQDIVRDEHGDPILDEYGKYVYNEYCTRCWKGAFYAPGATFPWCVVELDSPFDGTIKFAYKEGTPDEKIVYPWGEHVVARPNGYGCASIPDELSIPELKVNFSGEPHFNKADLHVTLIDEYGVESEANWSLVEDEASWIEAYGALYQEEVAYGVTPSYSGSTLTKEATQEYTYSFSGWTPEVVPVTEDADYTAVFSKTVKQYNVSLSGNPLEVTLSGSGTYNYGTVVEISATPVGEYVFDHWSDGVTASTRQITVTGDVTLTAYAKEPTAALAYWGKVPVSDFDTLGNTFSSTDLTSLLITPYEGGDQGSEVGYGDEAKTAITYEYVITSADEEAQSAYEEDYEPEPLYNYVMGNSMYYIYAIPSEYLSNATLSITDDYSSSWPTSSANTYVIDGVSYTIYKFIAGHTPIGDDPDYTIPETYFSVLDSPEYTEGYSYKRPTNFVLNKNL